MLDAGPVDRAGSGPRHRGCAVRAVSGGHETHRGTGHDGAAAGITRRRFAGCLLWGDAGMAVAPLNQRFARETGLAAASAVIFRACCEELKKVSYASSSLRRSAALACAGLLIAVCVPSQPAAARPAP